MGHMNEMSQQKDNQPCRNTWQGLQCKIWYAQNRQL